MTVKCLHVILWGKNSSAMVCEENFIKLSDQAPVVSSVLLMMIVTVISCQDKVNNSYNTETIACALSRNYKALC